MKCHICEREISFWEATYDVGEKTVCSNCRKTTEYEELKIRKAANETEIEPEPSVSHEKLSKIILTTETNTKDLEIDERLGVISSESALGMNIFRDIFTNVRDLVGGQSVSTQKILKDLKSTAFKDIREQAYKLGADAVVAIDLDYSEFSGSGKSMLFLVATGTAVKLKEEAVYQDQK